MSGAVLKFTMPTCCVYKCDSASSAKNACQTFPLPPETSPNLRKQWLDRINRKNFKPTDSARVCILHFSEDAFISEEENKDSSGRTRKRPRLKPLAVPTLHMKTAGKRLSSEKCTNWPCKQTDDHNYVQPPKRQKQDTHEATNEAANMPLQHDHSYQNLEELVEVILWFFGYLVINFAVSLSTNCQ